MRSQTGSTLERKSECMQETINWVAMELVGKRLVPHPGAS